MKGCAKYFGQTLTFEQQETTEIKNRIITAQALIYQVQTGVNIEDRLHLFNMVTWTLSSEHEKLIRSTQRKMLRLIIQTKRKYMKKVEKTMNKKRRENDEEPTSDEKAEEKDEFSKNSEGETEEGVSSNHRL